MRRHSTLFALIGCIATASILLAQVPGSVPPAGVAAAQQAAPAAAGAADVGFFGSCVKAAEDCKRRICATPMGTMLNNMTKPFSAMSGGIIPNFCPELPGADELAKPGVEGASAQAKKDAAEAKARRQAVRYLGTLDCRYYPEAEGALIAALRTDGVECVRFEAALVLGKGCCCSRKIIEALTHAVSCSEKDGNPAERSDRVRFAACLALERCLACFSEPVETKEDDNKAKEKSTTPKEPGKVDGGSKSSRSPDRNTIVAARTAIKQLHARYGLDSSRQINVTAQETIKLTPVPANTSVDSAHPVMVNTPSVTTPPAVAPVPVAHVRREPKSLFSVLRNAMVGEQPAVEQPVFQHPMQQYQQPTQAFVQVPPAALQPVQRQAVPMPNSLTATSVPDSFVPKLPTENSAPATFIIFDEMKTPRK